MTDEGRRRGDWRREGVGRQIDSREGAVTGEGKARKTRADKDGRGTGCWDRVTRDARACACGFGRKMRLDGVSDRGERRSGRKRDAFQSVIPYVIHGPDAQINVI